MEWYRRGHNEHDWKSCDGQKPSEGSNPSHSAKTPNVKRSGFSFFFDTAAPRCLPDGTERCPWWKQSFLGCFLLFFLWLETSLERVLTRKIVLYVFVCKTYKNGKIWSKFR